MQRLRRVLRGRAVPCPAGMLVSRRRTGRCRALRWAGERYRCGLVADPARHLPLALRWAAPALRRLALRWISAGSGCDSLAVVEPGNG